MRIAYLVVKNLLRGGGIEKYTLEVGRRLAARGHEITVFSMDHYGRVDSHIEGMRIVPVPSLRLAAAEKLSAGMSAALAVLFTRNRYDIAHFHSVAAGVFGPLPSARGMKTVLQMHGVEWQRSRWSPVGRRVLKSLEGICLKTCSAYTAVSRTQCDFYRKHYGVAMQYIPTGADILEPEPPREILEMGLVPNRYILFASRLVPEKGAHYLIRAFRSVQRDHKLVIAGDAKGEEEYKEELRRLADGDSRILFPGFVEGRKMMELFSNSAVYVQPSELEGLSIALLEAMSYGNCCLVSDIPENTEAIGDTGITFRSKDIQDLYSKLTKLLDADDRLILGQKARERVKKSFSWDSIASNFEQLYLNLLR